MRQFGVEFGVGIFLLIGIVCLSYLAINMGGVSAGGGDTYLLQARFVSASGLKEGAHVELAGVRVGKVARIELDPDSYEAVVGLALNKDVRVQEDAVASIRTQGIIGDKFVKISPGGSATILKPSEEIFETEPSISLEELISKYIFQKD
jgi:phospholipid/cholesterol/gamma-HCH transport system substrate-binding protein